MSSTLFRHSDHLGFTIFENVTGDADFSVLFNHGSMANALPQAIGAQVAYPKRQVISMSGDGGFAMLMGDFLTLNQHDLPVKVIIFNNSALSFVELEMKAAGILENATSLKNPNFARNGRRCRSQRHTR